MIDTNDWRMSATSGYSSQSTASRGDRRGLSEQLDTRIRGGIGNGDGDEGVAISSELAKVTVGGSGLGSGCTFLLNHEGDGGMNEFLFDIDSSALRSDEGEAVS